jgi:DNA polymerase-4
LGNQDFYYNVVRGIHNSLVKSNRITKSVAAEHTFDVNLSSEVFMMEQLKSLHCLRKKIKKHNVAGKQLL